MDRKQDIETIVGDQAHDESEIAIGIVLEPGAAMRAANEPRQPAETPGLGVAYFELMSGKPQRRDRLPRRCAGAFGKKNPQPASARRAHLDHLRLHLSRASV